MFLKFSVPLSLSEVAALLKECASLRRLLPLGDPGTSPG